MIEHPSLHTHYSYRHEFSERAFDTRAVHSGQYPKAHDGSLTVPIYQTSTFDRAFTGDGGWAYSRIRNPTRVALEECVADLESGAEGIATSAGMMAIHCTALALCDPGAHVLVSKDVYGGTWDLFHTLFPRLGLRVEFADFSDLGAVERAMTDDTQLVWVETPSNPMVRVFDIRRVAELSHARGARLAVDGTFASPALQSALDLGADVIMHSATKYLGGHSDVTGGIVVAKDKAVGEAISYIAGVIGGKMAPFDAWLVLRGIKTLQPRMRQICATTQAIADALVGAPGVRAVHYPGLAGHPDHDLASGQMSGYGGVLSIELDGDQETALALCRRTRLFTLAVSLGGVESLIQPPRAMTHCTVDAEGTVIPPSLVRLSIGLEDAGELIDDLLTALSELPASESAAADRRTHDES